MSSTKILSILALGLCAGLSLACGDEATLIAPGGPSGAAGTSTGNAGGTGGTGANTAGSGGTDSAAGSGGSAGSGTADCVEEPSAPADFLVRCTDSACRPFDNATRLGRFVAGQPLPEVP